MPNYNWTLRPNEIMGAISNMIISQQVFADNIEGLDDSLVNEARVDGGLYGDTKLYYSTDCLHSHAWGNDAEATNLLALARPEDPKCQAITLTTFRQVDLTLDNYLSKRAWSTEYAFSSYQSNMLSWLNATKRIYDTLTYDTFIGTNVSAKAKQNLEIEIPDAKDEPSSRLRAQKIAKYLADLLIKMKDITRDYNDYEQLRSYPKGRIKIIWNSDYVTEIKKIDLPSLFNKDDVFSEESFKRTLPARFFGTVNKSGGTAPVSNTRVRALVEKVFGGKALFPGDLLPDGASYLENETYTEDSKIICKVLVELPPFMSAFEVGTNFFNAKSLTTNHYYTWGHNELEHLYNYPFITIKAKTLAAAAAKTAKA